MNSFRDTCQECAARLVDEWENSVDMHGNPVEGPHPTRNDTRLCSACHVFDVEEEEEKRIPSAYVNNPTDYL
jgi:hypothetical protein